MTAVNLAVQPGRRAAFLITDCAHTSPEGVLMRTGGKSIAFSNFPCSIGVVGNVEMLAVGEECQSLGARNIATLVKGLPGVLRRAIVKTRKRYPGSPDALGILKVAAWSARQKRPVGYMIASDDYAAAGTIGPGWGAYEVAEVTASHGTEDHVSDLLGKPCQLEDAASFDPHTDAFALVAAQRVRPFTLILPGANLDCARIGGEVELVEVTRRGVQVWGCGTFPDTIGSLIEIGPDGSGDRK